jgi:phospholipid/cholesterol/gamma-HCH transport system permease protein
VTTWAEPSRPGNTRNATRTKNRRRQVEPKNVFEEIGIIIRFSLGVLRSVPSAARYGSEVLRQAAYILMSSSFVVWALMISGGFLLAEISEFLLTTLGAQAYAGFFNAAGMNKVTNPIFFGYIISAKVGCGIVAELGSMRINEEIDAMEVMGVDVRAYLMGTRLLAWLIVGPILFVTGSGLAFLTGHIVSVDMYGTVSPGGYEDVFWAFTSMPDLIRTLVWAMLTTTPAILIACYYGFSARGGPVGVGEYTARSMIANVIAVSILGGSIFFELFYGTNIILPIAN